MINGIHHVTALASEPKLNFDFYTKVLGLRLVKKTVNFDDPTVYHLYYGDGVGSPGTIITFFPYGHILPGKRGRGESESVTFAVPTGSLDLWVSHLGDHGVNLLPERVLFGQRVVSFLDPDHMTIELEESDAIEQQVGWGGAPLASTMAIQRILRVSLVPDSLPNPGKYPTTAGTLTELLEFKLVGTEDGVSRFASGNSLVDVVERPEMARMRSSAGTIHHVAFKTPNDDDQKLWLERVTSAGYHASPIMDRTYFHSIYFREPGGVLFEIATDNPGFDFDESVENLGTVLHLPPQFESRRAEIVGHLLPLSQESNI